MTVPQEIPDSVPLDSFRVPPDSVERAAGLLFFDRLDRGSLTRVNGVETRPTGGWLS